MKTLLLDRTVWDLCLDASGNIAVAAEPYAQAQDVASAIRLFRGELWYDTAPGLPYFSQILGKTPAPGFLKAQFIRAALTVPGVISAQAFLSFDFTRVLGGQVQFVTSDGVTLAATTNYALYPLPSLYAISDNGQPGVDDDGQQIIVG